MNKSKRSSLRTFVIMFIFAIIVIPLYFFLRTRTTPLISENATKTEIETLLSKDITGNYPSTPKEVIKLYSRITKNLYNEKHDEETIEGLAKQLRSLFDDELLEKNEYENYLLDLNVEMTDYRNASRTILSYMVEGNSSVVYWESEEKEYASIIASYTLKEDNNFTKIYENFVLRKDTEGNWKILGWGEADKTEINSEN
ncbi:MAG: hypothetical protein K0S41_3734 [Anaerocolumna sp.]|nr:hypothetical protein [Anaerocolumna sp.]